MAETTKIQWCDHTWNPWRGCAKPGANADGTGVAPECFYCYAEASSKRNPAVLGVWGKEGHRAVGVDSYWRLPVQWNAKALKDGVRRRVFFASLADVFEDRDGLIPHRSRAFDVIDQCPGLDFLILTKRPECIARLWPGGPRSNVWLGTSCGASSSLWRVDELHRSAHLANLLFISAEPLIEDVDFGDRLKGISWLIVGGESGHKARPFDVQWAGKIVAQCREAGVAPYVKQLGGNPFNSASRIDIDGPGSHAVALDLYDHKGGDIEEFPAGLRVREMPGRNLFMKRI